MDPSQPKVQLLKRHYACYVACGMVLIACYVVLGTLFVGLYAFKWGGMSIESAHQKLFLAFIWGALGGTTFVSVYFAKEANAHRESRTGAFLPNILEPLGYLLFVIGSGFTGLILVALIHAGFIAAYQGADFSKISDSALFVLAFIGGISADRVKSFCGILSRGLMKDVTLPSEERKSGKGAQ